MAIDISKFLPVEDFKAEVDYLIREIKTSPLRPGFKEIRYPGERAFQCERRRKREGIPIDEISWQKMSKLCYELGVDITGIMR